MHFMLASSLHEMKCMIDRLSNELSEYMKMCDLDVTRYKVVKYMIQGKNLHLLFKFSLAD